ncbi:ATP-dependent DNA helicase [Salinigranum sp. GCM10025319]|uniref:ATP-dependent DNA helicase n=1 Tax=Salinigranum sp. GCM10025319 TaxID=3252687 RepID=UPI00360B4D42
MQWEDVFGHDSPYPEQVDGIETAIETARQGGFTVLEGACGTGKTMLALTAGIDLVRDPDTDYERVVVLTSVKQQLRQFEADLETINANLPDEWRPVSGLTLVGKADVCPYARERTGGIDPTNVYERCEGLRERTRNLTGEDGPATTGALVSEARQAQTGLADSGSEGVRYLETADEPTPYLPETPEYDGTEFCPFYARYLDDLPEDGERIEAVPFAFDDRGLIDTDDLVGLAASHGSCPHSVMGALLSEVEIVIGNYYHSFDPTTAETFTGELIDDSTFVVCDEAHMLEPRVRDLVSDGVGDATLRDAVSELTRIVQPLEFDDAGHRTDDADLVREEFADADVTLDEVRSMRDAVEALRDEVDRRVRAHLDRERPDWRASLADAPETFDDHELPLREPTSTDEDELTRWAREAGHLDAWARAAVVGAVVARVLNELDDEDRTRAVTTAGRVLTAWRSLDHGDYFREIELERTWDSTATEWRRGYNARLALHNCLPGDAIADRLGEFGGGVLMSATLEPMDVFRQVTGLDTLADDGRPVVERTYGLGFPESNRASFAVDAPKYTYDNRGSPGSNTETREVYVDAVCEVARSPGNVLVGMPSYAEARWLADRLGDRVDKEVLLDESSDDTATESLKGEFFAGPGKVLVTSLRGTLTEGVDYHGDRLAAAVVCGVPIVDTSSPRTKALRATYDRTFGDGFRTALLVPAVRKARQALGRVIRGADDRGVRVLVDERYARESWDSVRGFLPATEREEFHPVSADMLSVALDRFWSSE